jgi:hypothetical protein
MKRVPCALMPVALLAALLNAPAAVAGEVERAEHTRVSEEMRKLAARNAWTAVEAQYRRLVELEAKGEILDPKEHILGGQAARALGDVTAARERFARAASTSALPDALGPIAEIDASYGRVVIGFDARWSGKRELVAAEMPFAPDQRAAVELAQRRIAAGQDFEGLLPLGTYSVSGNTVTVLSGIGQTAELRLGREVGAPRSGGAIAYIGPRASVGVSFTAGTALSTAGRSADAGLQAEAFGGSGARVGAGLELGVTERFGVVAQVGYHNLFGAPTVDGERLRPNDQYTVAGNNLHMGYVWLAANARLGDLWVSGGPVWGAGVGAVTGVDGYCVTDGNCEDISLSEETAKYQRVSGTVLAGGVAASVGYALVDLGPLRGALTLEGGAQTDSYRLYPWGQLAFTVAPSGARED